MESGRMTTQRCPSFSSLAIFTAAAMAVPELPPKHTKGVKEKINPQTESLCVQCVFNSGKTIQFVLYHKAIPRLL